MNNLHHRFLDTNGIRMHIAEQGEGPLVILCHGWSESWYSWRHQLPILAAAGYHVVAPDQRGYGQTDKPEAIEDYHIQEFTRSGFRGGLNWYRNIDRMWEFSAPFCGAQLQQPTLFVAGEVDVVLTMYPDAVAKLEQTVPNLTKKVILPGAGHWIQQERPTEVNALLVEFLKSV